MENKPNQPPEPKPAVVGVYRRSHVLRTLIILIVVAVIGARALASGMAFEALNHAGSLPRDLLVILNDTDASFVRGAGALSAQFARAFSGNLYGQLRARGKRMLSQMPTMRELARRSEKHIKGMVLPGSLFEEMGFHYRAL